MKSIIQKVGCRPWYIDPLPETNNIRLCSSGEEMKKAMFVLRTDGYNVLTPCTSMEEILYEYEESTLDLKKSYWGKEGTFYLGLFFFNSHFKDIYQTRYVSCSRIFLN